MQNLFSNLRYAVRQFRLSPVFTASAVLTLSLGIGGTTAIFTLIHAVMLRSLPVADPERLFRVGVRRPGVDVGARSLRTEYVTGNYFTTFGIGAFGGRVFTAEDDTPASPPVVVISHHSWEAIYGGDRSLV